MIGKMWLEIDKGNYQEVENDKELLEKVSRDIDTTIELHTRDYDEPIEYYHQEAAGMESLRLFYCQDDLAYSPI